jgi:hypothetical protein
MLEWLVNILKSLSDGKYTGGLLIYFKNGGISAITKPKEEGKSNGLKIVKKT